MPTRFADIRHGLCRAWLNGGVGAASADNRTRLTTLRGRTHADTLRRHSASSAPTETFGIFEVRPYRWRRQCIRHGLCRA